MRVMITLKADVDDTNKTRLKEILAFGKEEPNACCVLIGDSEIDIEKIEIVED